jgi:1-acyl-sn-glycerol-3-phosphate acyltransferase
MAAVGYLFLNLFQTLFLVVWSVFWITLAFVCAVLSWNGDVPLAMARRFWAPGLLWISGARVELEPLPPLDWRQPFIFVMNHQSMLDIPLAFAGLPANLRFVAKHVLRYVPFLGGYMWMTGMVFVDRSNRSQAVASLRAAAARIRNGVSILAYPEGTRSLDGRIRAFKKGVFVLALEAGVPVVPVAIEGTGKVLPTGGMKIRSGVVRMKVGTPIVTAGRGPQERDALIAEVRAQLIQLSLDLRGKGGDADARVSSSAA